MRRRVKSAWNTSYKYYKKAFRMRPTGAKPHSQIAILHGYLQSTFDNVYYSALSVGNSARNPVARDNLTNTLRRLLADESSNATDAATDDTIDWSLAVLKSAASLYFADSKRKDSLQASDSAVVDAVKAAEAAIEDPDTITLLLKSNTIFMIIAHDLANRFDTTVAIGALLTCASASLGYMVDRLISSSMEEDYFEADTPATRHLQAISLVCTFLTHNMDQLNVFRTYIKPLNMPHLAEFVNQISAFADMDGSSEAVPEDEELLGLACMRQLYSSFNLTDILGQISRQIVDSDAISTRFSRVAALAKAFADDARLEFFSHGKDDSAGFVVYGQIARRRDQIRLMKSLAAERLRDQFLE
eukprot:jgi/Hompol1/5260/HPOL_001882-RA